MNSISQSFNLREWFEAHFSLELNLLYFPYAMYYYSYFLAFSPHFRHLIFCLSSILLSPISLYHIHASKSSHRQGGEQHVRCNHRNRSRLVTGRLLLPPFVVVCSCFSRPTRRWYPWGSLLRSRSRSNRGRCSPVSLLLCPLQGGDIHGSDDSHLVPALRLLSSRLVPCFSFCFYLVSWKEVFHVSSNL